MEKEVDFFSTELYTFGLGLVYVAFSLYSQKQNTSNWGRVCIYKFAKKKLHELFNRRKMISVIMPTFMQGKFIKRAIRSVQLQAYTNWELIIVDDGSSDATKSIVSRFLTDSRIHYLYQNNAGSSCARNKGLEYSTGDYITYLDSDDVYHLNHIEIRRKIIVEQDVDFVFGPVWDVKASSREIYHGELADTDTGCVLPLMVMHKRCCLSVGSFNPNIVFEEDLDLFLRMKKYYKTHQFFDPVTAEYHVHDNSMHRLYEVGGEERIESYRNHYKRERRGFLRSPKSNS